MKKLKVASRRQPSAKPKGCWDVSPVPAGFWGNLEKADALWQDCLAGRTPADPIAKLAAISRLLGLAGPEGLFRIANVAYHDHALHEHAEPDHRQHEHEADELPRIICSEALV